MFLLFFLSSMIFFRLQLFNINHLTAGADLVRADPDKTCTLFGFNFKKMFFFHKIYCPFCFPNNRQFTPMKNAATLRKLIKHELIEYQKKYYFIEKIYCR